MKNLPAELRIAFKKMDAICDRLHSRVQEYSEKHSGKSQRFIVS
ncbi:MAG: hypothetical protein ACOX1G_05160 [bacterium]|jgi:hypothetical protein